MKVSVVPNSAAGNCKLEVKAILKKSEMKKLYVPCYDGKHSAKWCRFIYKECFYLPQQGSYKKCLPKES